MDIVKAIKDGSIEAVITFDNDVSERYMQSKEGEDVYRTTEPQTHFDARIRYSFPFSFRSFLKRTLWGILRVVAS